ncbi:MAG: hypothetical protein PHN26_09405 [Eubacteriaceae bacterium]|nr:hypothetical protein [Eubacteriaceae bacterium]
MENIQSSKEEEIKEIFIIDSGKKCVESDEEIKMVLNYLIDDNYREVLAIIPGVLTWYTDGAYYWSERNLQTIQDKKCGFVDGFIEHVKSKVKK